MGLTLYVLDKSRQVRRVLVSGVSDCIHQEDKWMLTAEIPSTAAAIPGEYLGLQCVDGRFRLFEIDESELSPSRGVLAITATDAAVSDLGSIVVEDVDLTGSALSAAVSAILTGTEWASGTICDCDVTADVKAYYVTAWDALKTVKKQFGVRIVPYYTFSGGAITGRVVDVQAKGKVFQGRIFDTARDAGNAAFVRSGSPRTRVYAVGKVTGTLDEGSTRLTIADAVWRTANGDPANKPSGQTWVEDAAAVALYGRRSFVYNDQSETNAGKLLKKAWAELQKRKEQVVRGSATAQDVESAPGFSHQQVRLFDLVAVAFRDGTTASAQVIGIKRDYVHPIKTKFTLGDEDDIDGIAQQVADTASDLAETATRVGGCSRSAEQSKEWILDNKEYILLKADKAIVDGLTTRINSAEIEIDAHTATIALKASQTSVTELSGNVDALTTRVSSAEILIDGANASIALKASQADVNKLDERVTTAESTLTVQAGYIDARVEKSGVISCINQTAEEIKIQAGKINLSGYVTASTLNATMASALQTQSTSITTENCQATTLISKIAFHAKGDMFFKQSPITKDSLTVVTGVTLTVSRGSTSDGTIVVTNVSLSKTTSTLNYLKYE